MGNNVIVIHTVGCHHNGRADIDGEQIAKRCVDELRAAGHSIISARHDAGGSIDLLSPNGALRDATNPDAPAQAAYERYLSAVDGKNFQGNPCPKFEDLPEPIKQGWRNAVDHTAARFKAP